MDIYTQPFFHDFHIQRNNIEVLNMLNTKYIIAQGQDGNPTIYNNPDANGNAWFVERVTKLASANEEIGRSNFGPSPVSK